MQNFLRYSSVESETTIWRLEKIATLSDEGIKAIAVAQVNLHT
jgi:hypothetical protein